MPVSSCVLSEGWVDAAWCAAVGCEASCCPAKPNPNAGCPNVAGVVEAKEPNPPDVGAERPCPNGAVAEG